MSETAPPPIAYSAPVRTSCARCGKHFVGSLDDGRDWFQQHLAAKHPNVEVTPRPGRPPIHRTGPLSLSRAK